MIYREEVPEIKKELAKAPVLTIIEENDCFAPRRFITMEYAGPNIREIIRRAPGILADGMRITGVRVYIDYYSVNTIDPNNVTFNLSWHGIRDFDGRSRMFCYIRLKDGLIHPDGSGKVRIEIYPKMLTTWERDTLLKRNPLYSLIMKIYKYIYYDEQQRKFLNQCKDFSGEIVRRTKEMLKLMETVKLPYHGM